MIDLKRYDNIILKLFFDKTAYHGYTLYYGKFNRSAENKYANIKFYIDNRFDNITAGLSEVLYRIQNNIESCPVCKTCGQPVRYTKKTHEYKTYCCRSCKMKDGETQQHIHNVAIQRYGSVNNAARIHETNMHHTTEFWDAMVDKRRQTNKALYGNENYTNPEKMKQTCLEKYGATCSQLSEDVRNKSISTLIEKYGVDHQSKSQVIKEKISLSNAEYWDSLSDEERNKRTDKLIQYWSNLSDDDLIEHGKKISAAYANKSDEEKQQFVEKARRRAISMWESFSEDEVNEIFDKIRKTRETRTPEQKEAESVNRSNAVRQWQASWSEEAKQAAIKKMKQTLSEFSDDQRQAIFDSVKKTRASRTLKQIETEHRNRSNGAKQWQLRRTQEAKDAATKKMLQTVSKRTPEEWKAITDKIDRTKRANNTYNTSSDEERCYEYLCKFAKNIKRQHKCIEYPYKADFVIFDFDRPVFIEYQGTWTHGFHPFDPNSADDIARLDDMTKKMSHINNTEHRLSFYESAIKTWTVFDPKKRATAKRNNLIYYEVWSYEEFKELVNKLYANEDG